MTDLSKILSISGQSGLYLFISSTKGGVIAESLVDKKRSIYGIKNRITTMADIAIYTDEGEVRLREVFLKMKEALSGEAAPSPKAAPEELKAFFAKVLPDYDEDRFYVSHMKKVVEWYNVLRQYASLDFTDPDAAVAEDAQDNA